MSRLILVVDDHPLCAAALTMAAHAVDPAIRVEAAASLAQAEARVRERAPDLVLLDLMLPDAAGFAGLRRMAELLQASAVAIVSSRDEPGVVAQAAALGASGFVPKASPMDRMVEAVRTLLDGGRWFPDGADAADPAPDDDARRVGELSAAQLRVLRAVAEGSGNKEIADALDLSVATVKTHLQAIFRKLEVANRTQAVLAFRRYEGVET